MKQTRKRKGFTLAELLVVIAIIAVLVVIAIPVFKSTKAKAEQSACMANKRSLLAEVLYTGLAEDTDFADIFETVSGNAICPAGGTYSWNPVGISGEILCSIHDEGAGGSGGSGSGGGTTPSGGGTSEGGGTGGAGGGSGSTLIQTTPKNKYDHGAVLSDETGTVIVITYYGEMQSDFYDNGKTVQEIINNPTYGSYVRVIDTSAIKPFSSSLTYSDVQVGEVYSDNGKYYYVSQKNYGPMNPTDQGWIEIIQ